VVRNQETNDAATIPASDASHAAERYRSKDDTLKTRFGRHLYLLRRRRVSEKNVDVVRRFSTIPIHDLLP
jgi:hypothetical protein